MGHRTDWPNYRLDPEYVFPCFSCAFPIADVLYPTFSVSNTAIPSAPPSAQPGTSTSAPPGTTLPSGATLPPGVTLPPGSTLIALPTFFPVTSTPGTLWFALIAQQVVFLQLISALYSNTLRIHTPIISTFASIVIVLAAFGVDENIFSPAKSQKLVAAGWLIIAFVDCLWVLCLTAGEGTHTRRIFDLLIGGGGLSGSATAFQATSTLERKFVNVFGRVSGTRLRRSQRNTESGNGNGDINLGISHEAFVVSLPRPSSEATRNNKSQRGSAIPGSPGGNRTRASNLTQSGVGSAKEDEEKEGSDDEGTMTEPEKVLQRLKAMALYPCMLIYPLLSWC